MELNLLKFRLKNFTTEGTEKKIKLQSVIEKFLIHH